MGVGTKQTGSWAISVGRCQAALNRAKRASLAYRNRTEPKFSPERAEECDVIASALRELTSRFQQWPDIKREDIELQRLPMLNLLRELEDRTQRLCRTLGPSY